MQTATEAKLSAQDFDIAWAAGKALDRDAARQFALARQVPSGTPTERVS
jgi:hypothetical protein